MLTKQRATVEDLHNVPDHGKAELVDGELRYIGPMGHLPARASGKIRNSLLQYEDENGGGFPVGGKIGILVGLPNRQSFSPCAGWHTGPDTGMEFLQGAPLFAAEIRSIDDYGPSAEIAIADKMRDYFAAGTLVVWDVDLRSDEVIKSYRSDDPQNPTVFRRDEIADAEPAVPGWRFPVNRLFSSRRGREAGSG